MAAAEDQSTSISVNGSGKDVPTVDFDELTDLIRYVVIEAGCAVMSIIVRNLVERPRCLISFKLGHFVPESVFLF